MSDRWYEDPDELEKQAQRSHRDQAPVPTIQGYTELRELARGGQGVVYVGRQASTGRLVAIKVMRHDAFASENAKRRFEREVEIIASLQHPNIVRIYDRGTTDDGRLYSVMEHIDGRPLSEHMVAQGVPSNGDSMREVLMLFRKICNGVHYAHLRGVVHRDLKPSNVRIDCEGEPHVLDFGLAKDISTIDQTQTLTETGRVMGSLPWASPEQAGGFRDGTDLRTDVYSLGVILYQLLTGRFPYSVAGAIRDTLNNIIEAEPRKPTGYNPFIKDDLQTIVLKALSKEPDRRYQAVGDLSRDIEHFLNGEPIEAKGDDTIYMLKKAIRQHRWPVAMAIVVLLLVSASSVVAWNLFLDASQKARQLEEERYFDNISLAASDFAQNRIPSTRARLAECAPPLRDWEWKHLSAIADTSLKVLNGHSGAIHAIAFSNDEKLLASASSDGTVRLWDVSTGNQPYPPFAVGSNPATGVAFSPDGCRLYAGGHGGCVGVWDTAAGKQEHVFDMGRGAIGAIAYDARDSTLLVGFLSGGIGQFNPHSGKLLRFFENSSYDVKTLVVPLDSHDLLYAGARGWGVVDLDSGEERIGQRHDGRHDDHAFDVQMLDNSHVACGDESDAIVVRDLSKREPPRTWHLPQATVSSLACSRGGSWIATGGSDGTVCVLNANDEASPWILRGHSLPVDAVAFSRSGRLIASGSRDNTIRIWLHPVADGHLDANGAPVTSLPGFAARRDSVALSADGHVATAINHFVRIWEAQTGRLLVQRQMRECTCIAFSPSNDVIAVVAGAIDGSGQRGFGQLYLLRSDTLESVWNSGTLEWPAESICFSPDGSKVAASFEDSLPKSEDRVRIEILEIVNAKSLRKIDISGGGGACIRYSPNGSELLLVGNDGLVRIFDEDSGREVRALKGHTGAVHAAEYSPDGRMIATAGADATCRLWDAESGEQLKSLRLHTNAVWAVSFSPDGRRLISAGDDSLIHIADTQTGRVRYTLRGHRGRVCSATFSPADGSVVSTDDQGPIAIWPASPQESELGLQRYCASYSIYLFDKLFQESGYEADWVERMIRRVQSMHPSDAELHEAFARTARMLALDADRLEHESWRLVERPEQPSAAYELGLRAAERACEIEPDNISFQQTLGVAQYRAGLYEAALTTLEPVARQRREVHDYAVLAMCHHNLGNRDEALKTLHDAKAGLADLEKTDDSSVRRFVDEADSLITASAAAE